ncbi:RNA-directed DNA polymerase, eukaryota, reverse transcriptase zinc-binding domain protein [Tanacetum coccineum]
MLGLGNKSKRVFFVELKWVRLHLPILDGKSQEELEIVIYTERSDNDDSWGWKNLLTIRDQVKENVIYKVGNGRKTSLWFDNWSSIGPLFQSLTHRDLYDERLNESLTVSDLVVNGKWKWPEDCFILWLAIQDRLMTQDKLRQWGNQALSRCCLCLNDFEDLKHLFFQCSFAKAVWRKAMNMTEIKDFEHDWGKILQTLINDGNSNNINSFVRRLIFGASVYSIWAERNRRIFQDKKLNDDVFKRIVDVVKGRILGLTVKDINAIKKMEEK